MKAAQLQPPPSSPTFSGAASVAALVLTTHDAHQLAACPWCGAPTGERCYVMRAGWPPLVIRVPTPHLARLVEARQRLGSP